MRIAVNEKIKKKNWEKMLQKNTQQQQKKTEKN